MTEISLEVPEGFRDCAESALMRLGYLYPHVAFSYDAQACEVHAGWSDGAVTALELEKEIRFQLYRERIHAETLPIRKRLYGND